MWDEVQAVFRRYREAGSDDPEAIRVRVWTYLLPLDDDVPGATS